MHRSRKIGIALLVLAIPFLALSSSSEADGKSKSKSSKSKSKKSKSKSNSSEDYRKHIEKELRRLESRGKAAHGYLYRAIKNVAEEVDELCGCEGLLEPVCADNGSTYVNACEADCAGATVSSSGICPSRVCGGETGQTCEDSQFCEFPAGCDILSIGRCEERPGFCSRESGPVCGCDGVTYANDCERASVGVPLDSEGPCDDGTMPPVACDANDGCEEGEFCEKKSSCDDPGACAERPTQCSLESKPVCGCDGVTYTNACEARANGASVASEGACAAASCGGVGGVACDEGFACRFETGVCETDPEGLCVKVPNECPGDVKPVCGCDGTTYLNECEAVVDGAQVESQGPCGEPMACSFVDGEGDACPSGDVCLFPIGKCDSEVAKGLCIPEPQQCPASLKPVCGCDFLTYDNACQATAMGVPIMNLGACHFDEGDLCTRELCAEDEGLRKQCEKFVDACLEVEVLEECLGDAFAICNGEGD